jgi:Phosphatidylinositol-4-phosphate 5-Kinase
MIRRLLSSILVFFAFFQLKLTRIRNELFRKLRNETWYVDEEDYERSFARDDSLKTIEDMGYSGSSFFNTSDGKYLVKSVPRRFEHTFFRDDLQPYVEHMANNPKSLLIRITDILGWRHLSIGGLLKLVPNYHIVMENLLIGQDEAKAPEARSGRAGT